MLGRMIGPFQREELATVPELHINRFGVIPKGHNTGKWRLITDLSYPPDASVNDGVDPSLCLLLYVTVERVAEVATVMGRGALMAKIDIEAAYRLVPVHPEDCPLQAVQWDDSVYVDLMLPFGLRSAPKLLGLTGTFATSVSGTSSTTWMCWGLRVPHSARLTTLVDACTTLGVPLAEHKREGPTSRITFLGIEIDTIAGKLRLLADKLQRLQALLQDWGDRKVCSRRELESLVGLLNHACKVVRPGRTFLRRMFDLLHAIPMHRLRAHPIRLNREFRSDLAWWRTFV